MEEKTILTLVTQSPIEMLTEIKVTFTPAQLSLRNSTVLCYVWQALSVQLVAPIMPEQKQLQNCTF